MDLFRFTALELHNQVMTPRPTDTHQLEAKQSKSQANIGQERFKQTYYKERLKRPSSKTELGSQLASSQLELLQEGIAEGS